MLSHAQNEYLHADADGGVIHSVSAALHRRYFLSRPLLCVEDSKDEWTTAPPAHAPLPPLFALPDGDGLS